ncbi:MAG TPA: hypothetical protein VGE70_04560 [Burkholderiaceae bacterium]
MLKQTTGQPSQSAKVHKTRHLTRQVSLVTAMLRQFGTGISLRVTRGNATFLSGVCIAKKFFAQAQYPYKTAPFRRFDVFI